MSAAVFLDRDGTLIEAWASQKSFQRKDGDTDGDGRNFRGQTRKNDTHASKTDPDARLYRKSNGAESRLAYLGHLLSENLHGLIADAMVLGSSDFAAAAPTASRVRQSYAFWANSVGVPGCNASMVSASAPSAVAAGEAPKMRGARSAANAPAVAEGRRTASFTK